MWSELVDHKNKVLAGKGGITGRAGRQNLERKGGLTLRIVECDNELPSGGFIRLLGWSLLFFSRWVSGWGVIRWGWGELGTRDQPRNPPLHSISSSNRWSRYTLTIRRSENKGGNCSMGDERILT